MNWKSQAWTSITNFSSAFFKCFRTQRNRQQPRRKSSMRSIDSLDGSTPRLTKTMCCSSSKFTTIPMELRDAVRNWAWGKSFLATSCRKSNQKRYLKCAPDSQQVRIREQEEESLSWLSYGRRHWPFSEIWKEKRLEEWQRNIFTNHLKSYSTIKYCLHCWC